MSFSLGRSVPLFRILGIRVTLDYSWFIVFFLFTWSLAYHHYPYVVPGRSLSTYLVMGAVSSLLLFVCVLIHELAHSVTANRLGLEIREITLFIFGGMAKMSGEPEEPGVEFYIAVAGPLASLALAIIFFALEWAAAAALYAPALGEVLSFLATINLVLLIFNLIPGFPLDGGRMLRAAWWRWTGDIRSATLAASRGGKLFASFLIVTGGFQLYKGSFTGGLWSVLIGFFLYKAAEGSYRHMATKLVLDGIRVGDAASSPLVSVDAGVTVAEAVERYFLAYHYKGFPVKDGAATVGIISVGDVKRVGAERVAYTTVAEAMEPISAAAVVGAGETLMYAYMKMANGGRARLLVLEGGEAVGMITTGDIVKVLRLRGAS